MIRHVVEFMDTQWMINKQLKWIGWDKWDYYAWVAPDGMLYRFDDLPRNEAGKLYEKEERKLQLNPDMPPYPVASQLDFYEWELSVLLDCGFCNDRKCGEVPDGFEKERQGGTGTNVAVPGWEQYASGNVTNTNYATNTGDTTYTGDTAYTNNAPTNYAPPTQQGGQGGSEGRERDYIPRLPYAPPAQLPGQPATQQPATWQPPTQQPPATRPRTPKQNPVLNTKKVVDSPVSIPISKALYPGTIDGKPITTSPAVPPGTLRRVFTKATPQPKLPEPNWRYASAPMPQYRNPCPGGKISQAEVRSWYEEFKRIHKDPKQWPDYMPWGIQEREANADKAINFIFDKFQTDKLMPREKIQLYTSNYSTTPVNLNANRKKIFSQNEQPYVLKYGIGNIAAMELSYMNFVDGATSIMHEIIHLWQQSPAVDIETSAERETMAYYFKLFPNQFIAWLHTNYPSIKPICIDFPDLDDNYKNIEGNKDPRKLMLAKELLKNYNRLTDQNKAKYRLFKDDVDKMIAEKYGLLPGFSG
jgi:hypothetical protein